MSRRLLPLGALLFLVGSGGWWDYLMLSRQVGTTGVLAHRHEHVGERLALSLGEVRQVRAPDRYLVVQSSDRVYEVRGDTSAVREGEVVTVGVEIAPDGALRALWVREHPDRVGKFALGIAGLLAFFGLLPVWYRWTPGGLRHRGDHA
ncbi:MAG: hypothetical protein JXX28_05540 [Deltaproteobacteria bacterium]|nr:hypothetical protein [Deltaproteobacteria bacterium]